MKRISLLLIILIISINCVGNNSEFEKQIELSDGKKVSVNLEEKEIEEGEKILVVKFQIEERILRHETVDKQVFEIWENLEKLADGKDLRDGIISAKYFVGKAEKNGEPIYEDFLFEAEKIENGTWKIIKVN